MCWYVAPKSEIYIVRMNAVQDGIVTEAFKYRHILTKHHGRVIDTPTLYLRSPRFKSRPGDLSQLRFFVVSLSPSRQITDSTLNWTIATSFHILSNSLFSHHPFI
jgi:hypothetical protein